jgi:hypothetical protein
MRIDEITTAQQLDLIRQIMNCTWGAIESDQKSQTVAKSTPTYAPTSAPTSAPTFTHITQAAPKSAQQPKRRATKKAVVQPAFPRPALELKAHQSFQPNKTTAGLASNAYPKGPAGK